MIVVKVHVLFFIVVFVSQANDIGGLLSSTFHCQERGPFRGLYIFDISFCDGYGDCYFGEDEADGCNKTCGEGKFSCDQGECKNITVRCNTVKDCQDGTDEYKCRDDINVNNCTREDQFLCKDGLRCLGLDYTCDGRCNCFDCSDENENCTKQDYELLNRCPHAYFVTAHGPQCLCSPNTKTSSSVLCNRIENCEDDSDFEDMPCHQHCIHFGIKAQCTCYKGYLAAKHVAYASDVKCISNETVLLLYSNSVEIKSSYENTEIRSVPIVQEITNCTLLTAANNYVYYVTFSQNGSATVSKVSIHSGKPEKLIEINFEISSIAIDYITNNIYFTGNGSLLVCTNDGEICKQLKCCGVGYVTLNPQRGFMFYTLQTRQNDEKFAVMRSNLDGSNETTISDNLYQGKVSIKIEESRNTLFLLHKDVGKKQVFHEISIESLERITDVSWQHLPIIQSFSPHKNGVFFIWPWSQMVAYLEMNDDRNYADIDQYYKEIDFYELGLNELYAYNKAIQHSDENPCNKSACSGLCLLKPETHSASHFLSFTCVCKGFKPKDGNHWCGNEVAPEVHRGIFWIVSSIIVVIILGIVAAYFIVKKKNCYFYYLTLLEWQQSKRDQRLI